MKKAILAMLTATVMILSVLAPLAASLMTTANAASPITSATVNGNLNSDTYTLYPYSNTSLNVGFSQYGEMIDPATLTGLTYGTVDPFAPSMNVYNGQTSPPQYEWIEGWILNCTYVSGGSYANIWAMATYSDYAPGAGGIGGNWNQMVTVGSQNLTVRGGRKTSGGAITTPITVLYNGPREYIATTTTTLYADTTYTTPLLNVTFTFVFDKFSKDVEVIKDLKRVTISKSIGDMQIQFGDRGEWDLGTGTPPLSYAAIFPDMPTVYNGNWQPWYGSAPSPYDGTYDVAQIVSQSTNYTGFAAFWPTPITAWIGATQEEATRSVILTSTGTQTDNLIFPVEPLYNGTNELYYVAPALTPIAYPQNTTSGSVVWQNDPMVFVGGVNKVVIHSTTFTDPADQVYWDGSHVYFPSGYTPAAGTVITLVYEVNNSKYTMAVAPGPGSPFIIGEWAMMMNEGAGNAFQGVTEYGVTDTHNVGPSNYNTVLDREVTYLLNQTFNPTDLSSAVEENTNQWVDYAVGTGATYTLSHVPAVYVTDSEWDQYNVNSERVEDLNTGQLCYRLADANDNPTILSPETYTVTTSTVGSVTYLAGITLPDTGDTYKILYSTSTSYTAPEIPLSGTLSGLTESQLSTDLSFTGYVGGYVPNTSDLLGANWTLDELSPIFTVSNTTVLPAANTTVSLTGSLTFSGSNVTVFKENTMTQNVIDTNTAQAAVSGITLTMNEIDMKWTVTAPVLTDLLINWYNFDVSYSVTVNYIYANSTATLNYFNATYTIYVGSSAEGGGSLYSESIPGSYNWGIVGTNAATVDSAGLSMVSAALKDKEVEYGLGGGDICAGTSNSGNYQLPFVMAQTGTAYTNPSWNNYYYSNFGGTYATNNDQRVGLSDDWDPYAYIGTVGGIVGTTVNVPVTTSHMIGIGGPVANMLSYYGNDFMDALYAEPSFSTGSPWSGNIAAVTCWNRNSYSDNATMGYAVISTAQDINGTTIFLLYGILGRDTYYAAQWFQQEGIYELQQAPHGLTSIILRITYENTPVGYKPTGFNVVECLGKVSETLWTGSLWGTAFTKGGFHDP